MACGDAAEYEEFQWDEWNEGHIGRHGVTPVEVEELFLRSYVERRSRSGRYHVFGRTCEGRLLSVIIEKLGAGWGRVVTAREMTRSERRWFLRRS